MGRKGKSGVISYQPVTIGGNFKYTKDMADFASKVSQELQRDFPELLSSGFSVEFNKYMGDAAGMGYKDRIELNGSYFKKALQKGDTDYLRGLIAHELTHTMQDRINSSLGLRGDDRNKNTEKIWDSAVSKFVRDNPQYTPKDINKAVSNAYGGGGHSRYGGDATERMAVAVERFYANKGGGGLVTDVGRYVTREINNRRKI